MLISDDTITSWVNGLPDPAPLHIVSLLGKKPGGFSEFDYYPFRSTHEGGVKPTFQAWLNERFSQRFVVHEFPTVDLRGIPPDTMRALTHCVRELIDDANTVVVVDSAGAERTSRVCKALGYERDGGQRGR